LLIERARLYLIVGARPEVVEAALRGGVDVVQLRVKDVPDDELMDAARELRSLCSAHGALFVVNDSPELAVRAGADGVHVGQDDISVAEARRIVGPDRLVGLSTHSPEQIAAAAGADYIGVGPVFATPTKPGRAAVGVELVREAARSARVPWFAIGGIDERNVGEVLADGATRIAVVRAIADAPDPEVAARSLAARLPNAPQGVPRDP
jgi:thiamine-phosphate pyrophosphorylase